MPELAVFGLVPELLELRDGVVQPILAALRERTTADQLRRLHATTPIAASRVMLALYNLRVELDKL